MSPRHILALGLLALLCLLPAGCGHLYDPYKITLTADDSIKNRTVAVDIVGINAKDYPVWESYPMSKYWAPGDTQRNSEFVCRKVLFDASHPNVQSIDIPDAYWKKWQSYGATHLFILANLPGFKEDRPGNADTRRQIIDIDNRVYEGGNWGIDEVKLSVTDAGIRVLTPIKEKK